MTELVLFYVYMQVSLTTAHLPVTWVFEPHYSDDGVPYNMVSLCLFCLASQAVQISCSQEMEQT